MVDKRRKYTVDPDPRQATSGSQRTGVKTIPVTRLKNQDGDQTRRMESLRELETLPTIRFALHLKKQYLKLRVKV